MRFAFPDPQPLGVLGALLQLDDLSLGYDRASGPILTHVSLSVEARSRISIVGANGSGKSTVLAALMGELQPWAGSVVRHHGARVAYFAQHHVSSLDLSLTPVQHLHRLYPGETEETYRQHLGSYSLTGATALQPMRVLSGGERSRVVFASITWDAPHILVLDEPSNHLDFQTLDALQSAIALFLGAVILVSHDQHLVARFGGDLYEVAEGTMRRVSVPFASWIERLTARSRRRAVRAADGAAAAAAGASKRR